ncbi:MAG: FAD-binding oxidoreductase [Chloroflexi bacterium]|nr:FAD-binding oxidoreductase [Chloroflexota bacterium]
MVKQATVPDALVSLLGDEGVLPPERAADFAVDGVQPQAVVAPGSVEEVAEVMRFAHGEGLAVIPRGGGTMMPVGNVPRRYDIALSLARLDRVLEHEPADLTVTCQAGITLAGLQSHLAKSGQFLPLNPPAAESATIGGVLAANGSGPWRHAYGTARDFTIGMRVVTADGRITKAGGRVVKNVAGYDLCKLYIGSFSTLGVIAEATFKVAPLPKAEASLTIRCAGPAEAHRLAAEAQRAGLSVRAVQYLNPAAATAAGLGDARPGVLLAEFAGSPQAVERSQREIERIARTAGASVERDQGRAAQTAHQLVAQPEGGLLCKASVLPSDLPALVERLERIAPGAIVAWPACGIAFARWSHPDDAESAVAAARAETGRLGGHLVLQSCPAGMKERIDVFGDTSQRPDFPLIRRVKEQFDPRGVLSPGRFLGRL